MIDLHSAGDTITIDGAKGRQVVTVVGFQVGTNDMVIDDGTGEADAVRFCDPDEIVAREEETTMTVIDFPKPPRGSASYIDRDAIEAACEALEQEVGAIVLGAQDEFDVIDPLAYEINAHLIAIRRAVAVVSEQDGHE